MNQHKASDLRCAGCSNTNIAIDFLSCSRCYDKYHYLCVNFSKEDYQGLSISAKDGWVCPSCRCSEPKSADNANTPIRTVANNVNLNATDNVSGNVTLQAKSKTGQLPEKASACSSTETIRDILRDELQISLKVHLQDIRSQLSLFKNSLSYLNEQFNTISEHLICEKENLHAATRRKAEDHVQTRPCKMVKLSENQAKRGIELRHNAQRAFLQNTAENAERNVLTLGVNITEDTSNITLKSAPSSSMPSHTLPTVVNQQQQRLHTVVSHRLSSQEKSAKDSDVLSTGAVNITEDIPKPTSSSSTPTHTVPTAVDQQQPLNSVVSNRLSSQKKSARDSDVNCVGGVNLRNDTSNITPTPAPSSSTPSHTLPTAVDQQQQRLNAEASNRLSSQKKSARDSDVSWVGDVNLRNDTSNITPTPAPSSSTPSHTLPTAVDQQQQRLNAVASNRLSLQKKSARDSDVNCAGVNLRNDTLNITPTLAPSSSTPSHTLSTVVDQQQQQRLNAVASNRLSSKKKRARDSDVNCARGVNLTNNLTNDTSNITPTPAPSSSTPSHTLSTAVDQQQQRLNAVASNRLSSQKKSARDSVTTLPVPQVEAESDSQSTTVESNYTAPPVKTFMLSSNLDNHEEITAVIVHLGGLVLTGAEFDPRATHLLCSIPDHCEKMICCVVAGRWVLHPAYIARSRTAGRFVDEQEYEWGNPRAKFLPPTLASDLKLARMAYMWRVKRKEGKPGPFNGIIALLHMPYATKRLWAKFIAAGDGVISDDKSPYTNRNITICFADMKDYPLSIHDSAWLASNNIPVHSHMELNSYLMKHASPERGC